MRVRARRAIGVVFAVVVVAVLAGVTLVTGGCAGRSGNAPPTATPGAPAEAPPGAPSGAQALLKGVGLTPRSTAATDFTAFFDTARQAGTIVVWAGDWNELAMETGAPRVLAQIAPRYGLTPVIAAQVFSPATGRPLRPFDEATCRAYLDAAVAFARDCKPLYLGLGVEVNILAEKSPADFERFVRLYDEVYDAVKAVSPKTKVFTVFQLEKMKGLGGGLFGGTNDPARAQWRLLSRFARLDLAAFTTYPGLVFKAPGDVPADYYS